MRNIRIAERDAWVSKRNEAPSSLGSTGRRGPGLGRTLRALVMAIAVLGLPTFVTGGVGDVDAGGSCLRISDARFNAVGPDRSNPNGEWVQIKNGCDRSVSLKGWRLRDLAGHWYRFPAGARLGARAALKVHTGKGTARAGHLYWGRTRPVWNNKASERAFLIDPTGNVATIWPKTTRTFVLGVNMNGPAVEIDGRAFRSYEAAAERGFADGDPNLSENGVAPTPQVKPGVARLLASAAWQSGPWRFRQALPNGSYELYLYTIEDDGDYAHAFDVKLEGETVGRDVGKLKAGEWKRWGPFKSTVRDGALTVDLVPQVNSAHMMAFEIWRVKRPGTPKEPPAGSREAQPQPSPTATPVATPGPTVDTGPTAAPTTAAPTAAPTAVPTTAAPTVDPGAGFSVPFLSRPTSGAIRKTGACDGLVIENRTFKDLGPDVEAIRLENCNNVTIRNNDFARVAQAITVINSTNVKIEWNRYLDIVGPHARVGKNRANFVQLVNVTRGSIGYNKGKGGDTEDVVSMYRSGGTSSAPFIIEYNRFEGTNWTSSSGSGIALGDEASTYSIARNNTLLNIGQVGMFIAGGTNNKIVDNVIFGEQRPSSNVGLYVWNQYGGACAGHEVRGNRVSFRKADGSLSPSWNGGNCGTISGWGSNDWNADLDPASLRVGL